MLPQEKSDTSCFEENMKLEKQLEMDETRGRSRLSSFEELLENVDNVSNILLKFSTSKQDVQTNMTCLICSSGRLDG